MVTRLPVLLAVLFLFFRPTDAQCDCAGECTYLQYCGGTTTASCLPCGAGRTQTSDGRGGCNPSCSYCLPGYGTSGCTQCAAGTYQQNTVLATSSPTCSTCPSGTDTYGPASSGCYCAAGYYIPSAPFTACPSGYTQPCRCQQCPAGSYKVAVNDAGPESCLACSYGTTQNPGSIAPSQCGCPAGQYLSGGTTCQNCPVGQYSNFGATSCTNCPLHTYTTGTGSTLAQCLCNVGYYYGSGTCLACTNGTYKATVSSSVPCDPCGVGMSSPTAAASFSQCSRCPIGTYQPLSAGTCRACPVGRSTATDGSTSIGNCLCGPGYGDGSLGCPMCPAGSYKGTLGNETCSPCGIGKTSSPPATTVGQCTLCPYNTYNGANISTCTNCPPATITLSTGSINLLQCVCPLGTGAFDTCDPCVTGTYKGDYSLVPCASCGAGNTSDVISKTIGPLFCRPCDIGTYQPADIGACANCSTNRTTLALGTVSGGDCLCKPGRGGIVCDLCPFGSWKNYISNNTCTPCGIGRGLSQRGAVNNTCQNCSVGQYQPFSMGVCQNCSYPLTTNGSAIANQSSCQCPAGAGPAPLCPLCVSGSWKAQISNDTCTPCGLGRSSLGAGNTANFCMDCDAGYYQDQPIGNCKQCAAGFTTIGGGRGSIYDCMCPPGNTLNTPYPICGLCPFGSYKGYIGNDTCTPCGLGNGTRQLGSLNISACYLCEQNKYQDQPAGACKDCAPTFVTATIGQASVTACQCPLGATLLFPSGTATCVVCPRGGYKDTISNDTCTGCGLGQTTPSSGSIAMSNCTSCPSNTYQDQSIGVCKNCSATFVTAAGGQGSVTACQCPPGATLLFPSGVATCILCSRGGYKTVISNDTCTGCGPGQTTLNNGSITPTDCVNCSTNTYQDQSIGICKSCAPTFVTAGPGSGSVTACQCPRGTTLQFVTGTATCVACPQGSYKDFIGNDTCLPCGMGNTTLSTGSNTSSMCIPCPMNYYQNLSIGVCQPCPGDSQTLANGTATRTECLCNLGFGRSGDYCYGCPYSTYKDSLSNAVCTQCPPHVTTGDVQSKSPFDCNACNETDIPRWGNNCSACNCTTGTCFDQFSSTIMCSCRNDSGFAGPSCDICLGNWWGVNCSIPCTCNKQNGNCSQGLTGNGFCTSCRSRRFSLPNCNNCSLGYSGADCADCIAGYEGGSDKYCTQCPLGKYLSQNMTRPGSSQACVECPAGSFAGQVGADHCTPCPVGQYQDKSGQSSCLPCTTPGYITPYTVPGVGPTTCVACLRGQMQPQANRSTCDDCSEGTWAPDQGSTTCMPCPPGMAQNKTGKWFCNVCPAGYKSPGGVAFCDICDAGSYSPVANSSQCTSCEIGSAQGLQGQDHCTPCQAGNYTFNALGQKQCFPCPPGSFTPRPSATTCSLCISGQKQPQWEQSGCLQCDLGTVQPDGNSTDCNACLHDEYQDQQGKATCITCPAGYTTGVDGSTSSSACVACALNFYKTAADRDCVACPGNQATQGLGSTVVTQCGCIAGQGLVEAGSEFCGGCAPGSVSTTFQRTSTCTSCPVNTYFITPSIDCAACPLGGQCNGSNIPPYPQAGWWQDPTQGQYVYSACVPAAACEVGGVCREGHTGTRCATCEPGWYKSADTQLCYHCPPAVPLIIAALFLLCVALCVVLVRLALKNAYIFACATVGFNFLQAVAVLPSFDVNWPPFVVDFFNIVTILNLDLQIFTPECMVSNGSGAYYYIFALKLFAPLIFAGIVLAYYGAIQLYYKWRNSRKFVKGTCAYRWFEPFTAKELVRYRQACISAFLSILIFTYLMLASTALEIYGCTQQLDGRYTMNREPIVYCYEPLWYKLVAVSAVAITVYVVGLPLLLLIVLVRRRRNLHKDKNIVRLGMLYLRYRPQQYFWELCVLLRKFGILAGKILFGTIPIGQVIVAFLTLVIASATQYRIRPYRSPRVNRLEALHLTCGAFVVFLGIMFLAVKGSITQAGSNLMGGLIVAIISLNIVAIAVAVILELRFNQRLGKHGVTGRFASDRIDVSKQFFDWGIKLVRHSQNQYKAAGLGQLSGAQGMDDKSTLITLELSSSRALDMRVQMSSADLAPMPVAPEGSSMWTRFTTYLRSLRLQTLEGEVVDQLCDTTPDGQTHTITMMARRSGLYTASIFALPNDGLYHPPPPHGPFTSRFLRRFDANYERKLKYSTSVGAFVGTGAQVVMHISLTVSGEWTSASFDIDGLTNDDGAGDDSALNNGNSNNFSSVANLQTMSRGSQMRVGGGLFAVELTPLGSAPAADSQASV